MDSVQAETTTVCPQERAEELRQNILVNFGPGSCGLTQGDVLRTRLAIATTIASTRVIRRDQITNITLACVSGELIAQAYSDVSLDTLRAVVSHIPNDGVHVAGDVARTSVLVTAINDESTTATTSQTTTLTTTPTTTTATTTVTTTPIHGELECVDFEGNGYITTEDRLGPSR